MGLVTVAIDNLSELGNVVDGTYRHVTKRTTPRSPLVLPDAYLKWYDLARADQTIRSDMDAQARAFVREEAAAGRLPIAADLGFVIHHLSGESIHLLLVCTWRNNNEMWESAYYKDIREPGSPYRPVPPERGHRGVICVWEFGAVAHEHLAWTAYLRSARDEAAKRAYLEWQFSGSI